MENSYNQDHGQYSSSNSQQRKLGSDPPSSIGDSFNYNYSKPVHNKAYIDRVIAELTEKIKPSHELYDFVGQNPAIIGGQYHENLQQFHKGICNSPKCLNRYRNPSRQSVSN